MPAVILVGANPGVLLRDAGQPTAFASVWQVDWSPAGAGKALILCRDGATLAHGPDEGLCRWLVDRFTRHFPESRGTGGTLEYVDAAVDLDIDLATGMQAGAAGVLVELTRPLDLRTLRVERMELAGSTVELSNVFVPCGDGAISVDGERLPGALALSEDGGLPGSSGFLAVAEVWSELD
jgi:hypothetical protein